MPPKCKFTKDEIIQAGLEMTRESGIDAVTARSLGERLGSSSRPIFSIFKSMDEVREEIIKAAEKLHTDYLKKDMDLGKYPAYKASGMAYIRFAKEEKELFKLLFMRDRSEEQIKESSDLDEFVDLIMKNTGLTKDRAYMLHLEMWVYVHGVAVMTATSYLDWEQETVSQMLTDVYSGLRESFAKKV